MYLCIDTVEVSQISPNVRREEDYEGIWEGKIGGKKNGDMGRPFGLIPDNSSWTS